MRQLRTTKNTSMIGSANLGLSTLAKIQICRISFDANIKRSALIVI